MNCKGFQQKKMLKRELLCGVDFMISKFNNDRADIGGSLMNAMQPAPQSQTSASVPKRNQRLTIG
jgi:hypothetical protein